MKVEVLFFAGCPGYEALLPEVRRLALAAGARLEVRAVENMEDARAERFLGSPTVRVDGHDVDPGAADRDDFGLKCRLYHGGNGQAHRPSAACIRAALGRRDA